MCGFVGAIGRPLAPAVFERAVDAIAHRGPDDAGHYQAEKDDRELRLGHRRLAIIDLSPGGAQPMHSHDGRLSIVFNGEIYNYQALAEELKAEGVRLRSASDTEVLLEAYARRGPAVFRALNGMFALAIYHHDTGELVLARDHLGVKPLYWAEHEGRLAFGSEIKSLLALGVPARLDRALLGEYLAQMWVQEPHTLFAGIRKLPAGTWARYTGDGLRPEPFWDLDPGMLGKAPSDPLERLEALLADAVRLQLIADRPVGSYISGGVDSSLITELATRQVPDLIAVSCRFGKADQAYEGLADDGVWADRFAARHPRMRHHAIELASDLYATYERMIWHLDEPVADPAAVPAYLLAQAARDAGAVVMLSGMGGDEIFGGYGRYQGVRLLGEVSRLPRLARKGLLAGAHAAQGVAGLAGGAARRKVNLAERFLQSALDPWPLAYVNVMGHMSPAEIDGLTGGMAWREGYQAKMGAVLTGFEDASPLVQAQRLDLKGFLASHNLIYSDKASMAASVEVRVPLLDYRLTEFAFALPDALRVARGEEKVLLKRLCARMVDPGIAYREKAGFAMPIRSWVRGPLREVVRTAVLGDRLAALLDPAALRATLEAHEAGRQENTWKLWTLLTLDLWLERFGVAA